VPVSESRRPFSNDKSQETFFAVLGDVVKENIVPSGYGMMPNEWANGIYPVIEHVTVGQRGQKNIEISLIDPIWKERATLWIQGLSALSHFQPYT
jgi:hypothetical protein